MNKNINPALKASIQSKTWIFIFLCLRGFALLETCAAEPSEKHDWIIPNLNMKMVYVEPGSFTMGSPVKIDRDEDETPHTVTITRGYWICIREVSQREYRTVMNDNPSSFQGDNLPVESVNWYDAVNFCDKLNKLNAASLPPGYVYRLPTEAEWEYAARGGKQSHGFKYSVGDDLSAVGWYVGNARNVTHETGTKLPNELGIYDMSGNVAEWCHDWFEKYGSADQQNPTGAEENNSYRVIRGGAWDGNPRNCRISDRDFYLPGSPNIDIGFRVVLAPRIVKNATRSSNEKP